MADSASLRAIVHGRVQGVFFRDFVRQHAQVLGLNGHVRNLPNGTAVEVVAEGPRDRLEELLRQLHSGPQGAQVERVDEEWLPPSGSLHSFEVRF
ncbi:MAG: acylphosphatase [Chloroflexota bacterium]